MKKYTIAIAGTTKRTTLCAEILQNSNQFEILWILTPKPKPIGRKQIITPNPLDIFAKKNNISIIYIEGKISNSSSKTKILDQQKPDFLLVVDFGYLIPSWLLKLPKIAPLNIHPSKLPRWRGSSPGQFSILFNDQKSAITLMVIDDKLDQGPIIHQDFFEIDNNWTQEDYYSHAFKLMCNELDLKIAKFADKTSLVKPQPKKSPTIIAKTITKNQAFVEWEIVKLAMKGGSLETENEIKKLSDLLRRALDYNNSLALTLERASKAFNAWPHLWTKIPTKKGEKRMKLLETSLINEKLILRTIQIEGKNPQSWSTNLVYSIKK